MARITAKDRDSIASAAAKMTRDVAIDLFTQRPSPIIIPGVVPCESCEAAEEVLSELPPLVPRLTLRVLDIVAEKSLADSFGITRVPTVTFNGALNGRIRFVGAPLGYEFSSFIGTVLEAGGAVTIAAETSRAKLTSVAKPVALKVFTTLT